MVNLIDKNNQLIIHQNLTELTRPYPSEPDRIQYRIALDLGSGTVKMQAAWIDLVDHRIVEMVDAKKIPVPLRDLIEMDPDQNISESAYQLLKTTLETLIADAEKHGKIAGCVGAATEAYRYARNGREILDRLEREIGITLHLLTQEEEADLGYAALKAEGQIKEGSIVWENGGGSLQISTRSGNGNPQFFNLPLGKVPMKNALIGQIQGKDIHDVSTPNPISKEDAAKGIEWVKEQFKQAPSWLKNRKPETEIIGLSAAFPTAVRGLGKTNFTKDDLKQLLDSRLEKTDEELIAGRIENPIFMVSDLILIYGIMEELGLEKIRYAEMQGPGSTSGLLLDEQKWPLPLRANGTNTLKKNYLKV